MRTRLSATVSGAHDRFAAIAVRWRDRTRRPWVRGLIEGLGILAAAAVAIGVVRLMIRDTLLANLRSDLGRTAEMAAGFIDGDRHATLVDSSQTDSPDYKALVAPLDILLRVNPDIRFAYTGIIRRDSMFFVLDGELSDSRAWVTQKDEPTPGEVEVWERKATVVERTLTATAWGMGIRAYAPIRNQAGEMVAHVGVTMSADRHQAWMKRVDDAAWLGLGIALLISCLGGVRSARGERIRLEADALIERAKESQYSRQKMEALGTLAGGVAHDFNNLLLVILGQSELIADEVAPDSSVAASAESIKIASFRARDLVRRILLFARPQPETLTPIHLDRVVDETVQMLGAIIPSSIEIVWQRPAEPVMAIANGPQLTQVLMNLAVNARQALNGDKGRVEFVLDRVDVAPNQAHTLGIEAGSYGRTVVRDNGTGISDETRRRIFEPFFTTKPAGQGSGMGLAVVDSLIRGHQGAIEVASTPGQGTSMTIYLPLAT